MRWMMIGELTSAAPATIVYGFRNSCSIVGSSQPIRSRSSVYRRPSAALERRQPEVQKVRQDGVQVVARADQGVVDPPAGAAAADLGQKLFRRLQVPVP